MNDKVVIPPDDPPEVDHTLLPIDYSLIPSPADPSPLSEWEPPRHVYFGKKLPNGRLEPEPEYKHKNYPTMMFALIDGRVRARIAQNAEEYKQFSDAGFKGSPAAFGIETCPGPEVVAARRIREEKSKEVIETAVVEIVKRPRGRPRKYPRP